MTEQKSENVSQMIARPEAVAQMVSPPAKKSGLVRMKIIMPVMIGKGDEQRMAQPGEEVEVTEAEALDIEKVIGGGYSVSGELTEEFSEASRHKYKRGSRIK